jgi:hypothetical protein
MPVEKVTQATDPVLARTRSVLTGGQTVAGRSAGMAGSMPSGDKGDLS